MNKALLTVLFFYNDKTESEENNMTKEQFIALGLDEETAKKCAKASSDELAAYVSKADYDAVVAERNNANSTIKARDKQLESLKKSNGDVEELQKQITQLQADNKKAEADHAEEIKQLKVDSAIESALMAAGARNMKAVRALLDIDLDSIKVKDDGTLDGLSLDEQIKKLKGADDSKFMFNETKRTFKGTNPADPGRNDPNQKIDPKDMSYEELCNYLDENPDAKLE